MAGHSICSLWKVSDKVSPATNAHYRFPFHAQQAIFQWLVRLRWVAIFDNWGILKFVVNDWSMVDGENIDFISNSSNYEKAYQSTQNDQVV